MARSLFKFVLLSLAMLLGSTSHAQTYAIMSYESAFRSIEGEQPFTYTYQIEATAFFDLPTPLVLPLEVVSLSRPAGVSEATALSYVSLSAANLTFGQDSQKRPINVFIDVPAGQSAGAYGYVIKVRPSAWPVGIQVFDEGSFINMEVRDRAATALPPAISITSPGDLATFTYRPAVGPLVIPYTFTAAATDTFPILSVDADLNNSSVAVTPTGINTTTVTGSGSLTITAGGLYTLRTRASNGTATASDSVDFTVVVDAPAPTITPTSPANNSAYNLTLGQSLSVPLGVRANSVFGNITSLSATLNGNSVSSLVLEGLNSLLTTGSGSVSIASPGSYTLVYTAANSVGSASATVNFTVTGVTPPPVVSISSPTVGTVVNRVAGSAASAVPFAFQASSSFGNIVSTTLTLNGSPVTATLGGVGSPNATGSGSFSVTTPGTYTMVVTASNGGAVASASRSFTVVETTPPPPPPTHSLVWLPPISEGQAIFGGQVMPVRFSIARNGTLVSDQSVVIAIYEVFANGTSAAPKFYTFGAYCIISNVYNLNFTTGTGARRYKVEVYTSSATSAQLLGTKEITTKARSKDDDCDDDDDDDDDDRDGDDRDDDRDDDDDDRDDKDDDDDRDDKKRGDGKKDDDRKNDGKKGDSKKDSGKKNDDKKSSDKKDDGKKSDSSKSSSSSKNDSKSKKRS